MTTHSPAWKGNSRNKPAFSPLRSVQTFLDSLDIRNQRLAHLVCKLIPSHCPFERDVVVAGRKLFYIPAMCKLNPLYDQLVGIRFRALCYLADQCHEDVTPYLS